MASTWVGLASRSQLRRSTLRSSAPLLPLAVLQLIVLSLNGSYGLVQLDVDGDQDGGRLGDLGAVLGGCHGRSSSACCGDAGRRGLGADEARHRGENQRLRAIYDLTSTLTATLSYKRVLDAALDLSYSALNPAQESPGCRSSGGGHPAIQGRTGFRSRPPGGFTSADARAVFVAADGMLKRVFDEGEPAHTFEVSKDPELGRVIAFRSCRSAYCCPLRTGFSVYGALLFAHPDADYFTSGSAGRPGHHCASVCHRRAEFPAVSGPGGGEGTHGGGPRGGQEEAGSRSA